MPEPFVQTARIERAEIRETTGKLSDSADRRTELAADRTQHAAERTYAAWVRTGLAALAGSVLTLFSAFCFGAGARLLPACRRRIPRAVVFVVNGFPAVVAIAALASIWATRV